MSYLPSSQGPRTSWDDVIAVTEDPARLRTAAEETRVSSLCLDDLGKARIHNHDLTEAATFQIERLDHVRRPVSYRGMRNAIGRMALPGARPTPHSGWFESRNEQENYRALLIERPVAAMATQPMRLEWPICGGVRTHVPDALYSTSDGRFTLLDITTTRRLDNPQAMAVFLLARASAEAMGWGYEVRTALEPQHQRNVSFIYSHRHCPDQVPDDWADRIAAFPPSLQLRDAAVALGHAGHPAYAAVFHLVAIRRLFLNLTQPLTVDALVRTRPLPTRSTPCLPAR